jgi:hypothetical protein
MARMPEVCCISFYIESIYFALDCSPVSLPPQMTFKRPEPLYFNRNCRSLLLIQRTCSFNAPSSRSCVPAYETEPSQQNRVLSPTNNILGRRFNFSSIGNYITSQISHVVNLNSLNMWVRWVFLLAGQYVYFHSVRVAQLRVLHRALTGLDQVWWLCNLDPRAFVFLQGKSPS